MKHKSMFVSSLSIILLAFYDYCNTNICTCTKTIQLPLLRQLVVHAYSIPILSSHKQLKLHYDDDDDDTSYIGTTTLLKLHKQQQQQQQDSYKQEPINDNDNEIKHSNQMFTLMTWNILAPVYTINNKYSYCTTSNLDWNISRCQKIIKTIQLCNADIVCLQEVQIDLYYNDLLPYFQQQQQQQHRSLNVTNNNTNNNTANHINCSTTSCYYTCILQNVTKQHPVACATLIKTSKFHIHSVESRSRALLVILQDRKLSLSLSTNDNNQNNNNYYYYIANVHLDARYDQDITRYNQIKSLLHRIEYHYNQNSNNIINNKNKNQQHISNLLPISNDVVTKTKYNPQHTGTSTTTSPTTNTIVQHSSTSPIIVIAGDFNMERTNPIYKLLSTGTMMNTTTTTTTTSIQRNNNTNKLTTTSNNNNRKMITESSSLPFLPLQDVYNNKNNYNPIDSRINAKSINTINTTKSNYILRRTFASGAILDYIWINQYMNSNKTTAIPWIIDPIAFDTNNDDADDADDYLRHKRKHKSYRRRSYDWPSKTQPSDHIPIGVQIYIK